MTDKIKLTKTERLILANQYQILEVLGAKEAERYRNHRMALERGYALHFTDAFENISDEMSEEECTFVLDVLSMYRALHASHEKLKDKTDIDASSAQFLGFDGNNEPRHLAYCHYFCEHLGNFSELCPIPNSHRQMLDIYRRTLRAWEAMGRPHELTKDQIGELQMAQVHPEHKPGEDDVVQ